MKIRVLLLILAFCGVVKAQERVYLQGNIMFYLVSIGYNPIGDADWERSFIATQNLILSELTPGESSWPFFWDNNANDWFVDPTLLDYQVICLVTDGWNAVKNDFKCPAPPEIKLPVLDDCVLLPDLEEPVESPLGLIVQLSGQDSLPPKEVFCDLPEPEVIN